jgi:uncharacterized protein YjiS (DUF1127 family)
MITDRIRNGSLGKQHRTGLQQSLWLKMGVIVGNPVTTMLVWRERARQRRELLGLNDHALHDFGVNRADATSEGDKPFWRP